MTDPDLSRGSPNDVDHQNEINGERQAQYINDLIKRLIHASEGGHYPRKLAKEAADQLAILSATRRDTVTVGMVTAALAAVGEHEVSLLSMRRREVTKMIQAALDWRT